MNETRGNARTKPRKDRGKFKGGEINSLKDSEKTKKGIYLGSKNHRIPGYNIDYNDIINYEGINIIGDMMTVDINKYDFVIATPPCNYYSRANYRRETITE